MAVPGTRFVCEVPRVGGNLLLRRPQFAVVNARKVIRNLKKRIAGLKLNLDSSRFEVQEKLRNVKKCKNQKPPYIPTTEPPPPPPSATATASAAPSASISPSATATIIASPSPSVTVTSAASPSGGPTVTPTATPTATMTSTATPTLYIPETRIRPFLSFLWGAGSANVSTIPSREEREKFYRVMHAHYSTALTSPSTDGHAQFLRDYRREVLSVNPEAKLGVYMSAVTSTNPVDPAQYDYGRSYYVDHDNDPETPSHNRCADPGNIYNHSYRTSTRPDSHSFFDDGSGSYQPLNVNARESSEWAPWGPGVIGWWPFEHLLGRGLISQATTLFCRPTIRFDLPETQAFVSDSLLRLLQNTPQFESATMITFDNGSMVSQTGGWPARGEPGSRYESMPPDQEFSSYLQTVRSSLNAAGYSLAINTGHTASRSLAGSSDIAFFEYQGISRATSPQDFASTLEHYRTFMHAGTAVIPFYVRGPQGFTNQHDETRYYIASSMLMYEEGLFSFVPLMHTRDMANYSEHNALRFISGYFHVPSCLGDPSAAYATSRHVPHLYFRRFRNGYVVVNAGAERTAIPRSVEEEWGLTGGDIPPVMAAKSAAIIMTHCNCLSPIDPDFESQCRQWYSSAPQLPPLQLWDLNCDEHVDRSDGEAFQLYLSDPAAFAVRYPFCSAHITEVGDYNEDGRADQIDYQQFYFDVIRAGSVCGDSLDGDTNCDSCIDNGDIDPFLLARFDPEQYMERYPGCSITQADIDGDRDIDDDDADLLVQLISGLP